jgi:hypothetical protein
MSQLSIYKKGMNLPTYKSEDCKLVSVSSGMASGIKFIRLDGKQFVIVDGGVKTPINSHQLVGVIVNAGPISKRYYKKKYTGKDTHAPDCASADGEVPDAAIIDPECKKCETCPKNAWGSREGYTGKKAKACQEYRRLAFCITDEEGNHSIYRIDVPAASLNNLRIYGSMLEMHKKPIPAVMTKITFDPDASYQRLKFDACEVFPQEQFDEYKTLGQSSEVINLLNMQASAEIDTDLEDDDDEEDEAPKPKKKAKKSKTVMTPIPKKKAKPQIEEEDEDEDEEEDEPVEVESVEELESELDAALEDEVDE